MDELSNLLNEAKPLYKQRKRRKAIAKSILALSAPAILMSSICLNCIMLKLKYWMKLFGYAINMV